MDKNKILKEWKEYNVIMDNEYNFLVYDTLNRIANALEKIAEDNKPWQKMIIDTEGWRIEK
jgi:hypothetical protein